VTLKIFKEQGYCLVKNFLPKDLATFLSSYLKVQKEIKINLGQKLTDTQVPNASCVFEQEPALEALYVGYTHKMEKIVGLSLLPTYAFARIYKTGNILAPHKDRPACEISATIKLEESDSYSWPICIEESSFNLDVGDAVIYRGCDVLHWRDKCKADEDYFLSQLFLHFVDKQGPHTNTAFDQDPYRAKVLSNVMGIV
tara:strand:- start:68 stop:661 length:594 start_codon:yes stop_codon:yes gene_type:complete